VAGGAGADRLLDDEHAADILGRADGECAARQLQAEAGVGDRERLRLGVADQRLGEREELGGADGRRA
jgi:hypothetical protein